MKLRLFIATFLGAATAIDLVPQFLRRGNTNTDLIDTDNSDLETCFPDNLPWYTYKGNDYIFTRKRYNSICVDSNNRQYQWGKVDGIYPPIDEEDGGCSDVCISGYGRASARGCSSMKPNKLVGFNYNCDEAACYCLYEKNTWNGNSSPCFDEMDTSYNGQGDVSGTKTNVGSTCYSLRVQSAPSPGPPPGSSICTYAPDYECYKTGWPACCDDDGKRGICCHFCTYINHFLIYLIFKQIILALTSRQFATTTGRE